LACNAANGSKGAAMSEQQSVSKANSMNTNAQNDDSEGMSYLDGGLRKIIYVYLPLAIIMVVLIFPFYWMVLTSIKPDDQLIDMEKYNPFFVVGPTLKHINK
jgi:multiple sugar transport system permease protein